MHPSWACASSASRKPNRYQRMDTTVENLSLLERIGQVLCFGWQGDTSEEARTVNAHARALVREMQVGGVVLLGRNVDPANPQQIRHTLAELQRLSRIPLFIAIDQEGGTVNRLRAPFHEFPGNMALGATRNPDYACRQAQVQARELLALGINWNFAPVMDVNNNPDNPIIGVRSYGADPELVAQMGTAAIRGYQQTGLLACAKHFPGHGDTSVDSHLALPVIPGDRQRLESVELVPFRAAIAAGVGAIMTTHILFPALDAERPATLSRNILTGLLREQLGYNGLVITDCLEMKAIADTVGTARGAVEALKAGADMVLIGHTLEVQRAAVQAIREAVDSGDLPEERLNEAVSRVLAAKCRFLSALSPPEGEPWWNPEHDALEQEIVRASITVVRSAPNEGYRLRKGERVAVVSAHHSLPRLAEEIRRYQPDVLVVQLEPTLPEEQVRQALQKVASAGQCLVATSPPEQWSNTPIDQTKQAELVRALHQQFGERLIVVALREPYDIRRFPEVENYLCTYGYRPCSLRALADALFGQFVPTGKIPVGDGDASTVC
ncbi:MAG: beta-hexosaminidase [Armatimonadota bacterium]|nr:MAG: beta-hexosaminidase [Armatimonadota bacterium]